MQDYIMRLIQQVAQMLAAAIGHRNAGRIVAAQEEIERACLQTAAVPLSMIRHASPQALREFLPSGAPQHLTRDILLAELLLQDAELQEHAGLAEAATHSRVHAFCLIADAVDSLTADDAADYRSKLADLATKIEGKELDSYVVTRVAAWQKRKRVEDKEKLTGSGRPASAL